MYDTPICLNSIAGLIGNACLCSQGIILGICYTLRHDLILR